MQDLERFEDRLYGKLSRPGGDTIARQVRDGLIDKAEAERRIEGVYRAYLQNCRRDAPVDQADGLEKLGIKVPTLILDME